MFFTGLFSTHIPYIILAAIYSVSFGIYSVYYVKNKILSKEQPEKEIRLSENSQVTGKVFHFKNYNYDDKPDDCYSPGIITEHGLKSGGCISGIIIAPYFLYLSSTKEFGLYSRPPPLS